MVNICPLLHKRRVLFLHPCYVMLAARYFDPPLIVMLSKSTQGRTVCFVSSLITDQSQCGSAYQKAVCLSWHLEEINK